MSIQLESRHFFRRGDVVRHLSGRTGEVTDSMALYATIRWDDGLHEEVEQLDRAVVVMERARGNGITPSRRRDVFAGAGGWES